MRRFSSLLGWLVLATLVLAQDHTRRDAHEMHRLHQDPQAYIAMLDDPQRDAYQKPDEVITALNIKEGEVIADLGAGSRYFTFRLARHVGEAGRVHAVDVNPEMIVHLEMRIDRDDLVREMERNGFRIEAEHAFLPYQYFLVFQVK
jgi:predicted methyltransferase